MRGWLIWGTDRCSNLRNSTEKFVVKLDRLNGHFSPVTLCILKTIKLTVSIV